MSIVIPNFIDTKYLHTNAGHAVNIFIHSKTYGDNCESHLYIHTSIHITTERILESVYTTSVTIDCQQSAMLTHSPVQRRVQLLASDGV